MLKVLFIVPTSLNPKQMYLEYPMGAGYICTYLKKIGHETRILDQNAEKTSDEEVLKVIEEFKPHIIAFSIMTPCYPRAKIQMNLVKEFYPDIPIVAGGVHVSIFKESLFSDSNFDAIVLGEGEIEFQKLCLIYEKYRSLPCTEKIKVNSATTAEILKGFPAEYETELFTDELLLDRSVYNLKLYTHHSVLAARGCPFQCRFCCNYSRTFGIKYSRSVDSVIKEIEILEKEYGASQIFFADDIFFQTKAKIEKFCNSYRESHLSVSWIAQLRVNTIDEKIAKLMKGNGCIKVCFGIESGSQNILDAANKKITLREIRHGIEMAKNAGLRVKTFWILGLPGSYEEQLMSLDLMLETKPNDISIHQLVPFPGTDYYNYPEKYGIKIKDKQNFESFCYGGLSDNFEFDYLSTEQINHLLEIFSERLETAGYVSSDKATPDSEFVYSLPISKKSIQVFQNASQ